MAQILTEAFAKPLIVAHRGASATAPENTLAAFRLAWEQGADAIEGDFHLTQDNQIICIHDKHTGRVSNKRLSVRRNTLAELLDLDVGSWKSPQFSAERIPTLSSVLETVPSDKQIFIELKQSPKIGDILLETLDRSSLHPDQFVVITFDRNLVKQLKTLRPTLTVNLLSNIRRRTKGGPLLPSAEQLLEWAKECDADGIGIYPHPNLSESFANRIVDAGYALHIWTVDDPKVAKKWSEWGVRSITTNTPAQIIEQLR